MRRAAPSAVPQPGVPSAFRADASGAEQGPARLTPLRYQQLLRLERAEHLIGHGATVEAAARTVGFQDARMLLPPRPTRPTRPVT